MEIESKDPVCGAAVEPGSAIHEKSGGKDYTFCSDECRIRFIVNPGRYLSKT